MLNERGGGWFTLTRKRRRISTLLMLAAVGVSLWSGTASAHSFVKSTNPKAGSTVDDVPNAVLIRFNEPVELAFGEVEVIDPTGSRVDVGEVEYATEDRTAVRIRLAPELVNGSYTVEWRVVSADGHPREGRFRFRLRQPAPPSPSPPATAEGTPVPTQAGGTPPRPETREPEGAGALPSVLLGITRWVLFASLLLLVGLVAFALAVWRPTASSARPSEIDDAFHRRWWPVVMSTWVGAVVASVASLPLEGAVAADVPLGDAVSGEVLGAVLRTRFGLVTAIRVGLLVLLAAVLVGVRAGQASRVLMPAEARRSLGAAAALAPTPRRSLTTWVVFGLAVLATIGLTGHAGTTSPVAVSMAADVAHLAGAAFWLGGLVSLIAVAFPATRGRDDRERVVVLAPVVSRFSDLAVVSVVLIVASGTLRAWMEIRTLAGLTGEAYGIALLIKLVVVVPLLVLGAINNRWTKPRIRRAAQDASLTGSGTSGLRTLNKLVLMEVLLAAVVLAVTAILVNLAPPTAAMEGGH